MAVRTGRGQARLAVSGAPTNLTRQANRDVALTLYVEVDRAPTKQVTLGMSGNTVGKVDPTETLRMMRSKGWTTIQVPLSCFRNAGADMSAVTTPLELATSGRLAIGLSSAKQAEFSGSPICPAPVGM